ncbi:MAG: copper homeostasis protein CutC [Actinoplanes sp.]
MRPAFELAVQDTYGVAVAARLGVDRIELCAALPLGGVTPSLALIEAAADGPPAHVLVRPRAGGFDYTPDEADLIVRDVRHALTAGAAGVVVGGVRDGQVDDDLMIRVVDAAAGAPVTFHRAFDTLPDPAAAVETLVKLGVRRILTAAGPTTVGDALPALAALVTVAAGRIEIMAGGGVRPDLIGPLVRTGVDAIHASAKRTVADTAGVRLGSAAPVGESGWETTDEQEAARIITALR